MTYNQLWTWVEFNKLYPFTLDQDDYRVARIVAAIYNVNIIDQSKQLSSEDLVLSVEDRIRLIEQENERQSIIQSSVDQSEIDQANWTMYMRTLTAGKGKGRKVPMGYRLIDGGSGKVIRRRSGKTKKPRTENG